MHFTLRYTHIHFRPGVYPHSNIPDLGYTYTHTFQTWDILTLMHFRPGVYSHSYISDLGYTHTHTFQTWGILTLIHFRPGVYSSYISDLWYTHTHTFRNFYYTDLCSLHFFQQNLFKFYQILTMFKNSSP